MKKLLISIIIILVLILTGVTVVKGIEIGNFKILGIMEIKEQDEELDNKIKDATKLASTDYQKSLDDLDKKVKDFEKTKTSYEDMINVSTDNEIQAANQYGVYEIGMLWIKLGNHAKSEGVKMDVSAKDLTAIDSNSTTEVDRKYNCNLYFTATGTYAGIAGFIENIEDDSKLGFRIEDFKITASSEESNTLQATFTCKDIIIRGISMSSAINQNNKQSTNQTPNSNNTTDNTVNNTTNNEINNTINNTTTNGNNTVK